MIDRVNVNGVYNISIQHNKSFSVFCGFGPEPGAAWTLIQSHSLNNNYDFQHKAFYLHDMPRNQDVPEWNNYRLSMSRSLSKMFQLTGGPLTIFPWMALTVEHIRFKNRMRVGSVFWPSLFMSVVTPVSIALCWLVTAWRFLFVRIATMVPLLDDFCRRGIADADNLRHYSQLFALSPRWMLQLSSGSGAISCV